MKWGPELAHNATRVLAAAKALHNRTARPNLFIETVPKS
jgi:hypothetical protein